MEFSHIIRSIVVAGCCTLLLSCDVNAQGDSEELELEALAPLIKVLEETRPLAGSRQAGDEERMKAYGKLWMHGPRAKRAVPEIIRVIVKRHQYASQLPKLLERIDGKNALTAYYLAIANEVKTGESADQRKRAANHLKYIDMRVMEPKDIIDPLVNAAVNDSELEVRKQSAWTLRDIYEAVHDRDAYRNVRDKLDSEKFVEFFVSLLKDEEPEMRRAGAMGLEEMGSDAAPGIMPLLEAINDAEIAVRIAAIRALGGIGPPAKQANSVLVKLLKDEEFRIREPTHKLTEVIQNG